MPAFEDPGKVISLPAAADLSANQFHGVVVDGSGDAALAGNGVQIAGILQNKPDAAGKAAQIMVDGISKAVVGAAGAVAPGDALAVDASGEFDDALATEFIVATALETGAAAEIIAVLIQPGGKTTA